MNTSYNIYKVISKKFIEFKNVKKYTSSYQTAFNKVASLFVKISLYIQSNIKSYFQIIILMNINSKYSILVLVIQKEWKSINIANLFKAIL